MRLPISLLTLLIFFAPVPASAGPEGQMTWGLHFSPTPGWFDPSELAGSVTSYHTLYALHDAMIRPSPGPPMSPSLAESWSTSPDGLVYEFVLRKGVKFHNGDRVSVEDVKFSFERYRATHTRCSETGSPASRPPTLDGSASGSSNRGRTS
jgi:peptide/nickel transport system substrate-binding protein